jgi:DNA-binding transcriptional LysR family regulator
MRLKNLDLNLLIALDVLLSERNVSRAAEQLHMTQSAMSNALARLRDYFGDELLVRVGRGLELTPRAELLREPVRDILVRVESSVIARPEFDPAASDRTFRIYVSDYSLTTLVPAFLKLVAPRPYSVRFEFAPQTNQPLRTLERGEADLLIIPEEFAASGHPCEVIYEETFACIADASHPRIGERLTRAAFQRERHAVMQPAGTATSFETEAMRRLGITRDIDVVTFSFASLPDLVAGTERLATVHARIASRAAQYLPLRILELPFKIPAMRQSLQWHAYRSGDPAIVWLRQTMRSAARLLGPIA